jgi:hypothetical protein
MKLGVAFFDWFTLSHTKHNCDKWKHKLKSLWKQYASEKFIVYLLPKDWNYFSLLHELKSQVISLELKIDDTKCICNVGILFLVVCCRICSYLDVEISFVLQICKDLGNVPSTTKSVNHPFIIRSQNGGKYGIEESGGKRSRNLKME